jgi:hypothetical protein
VQGVLSIAQKMRDRQRAVTYSPPCGFGVIEKWRAVSVQFGVYEAGARRLCTRFGVDADKMVPRLDLRGSRFIG